MWGDVFPICGDVCGDFLRKDAGDVKKPCQINWQG
jgi:hypothetical protein